MKKLTIIIMAALALTSCGGGKYGKGVPQEYYPMLDAALAKAGENSVNLRAALDNTPKKQREGMAYLISYMPEFDLKTIDVAMLEENVKYTYKARREFPWAKKLPKEIFLNEVLPYASVDETRENWRKPFYETFGPKVAGLTNVFDAIDAVNRDLNKTVGVEYNTLREKTNQSPAESMRQNMASCTGLSIILVDALRSVGIPARFAGTAAWHDNRGNHSWVEVWADGKWYFTEFYPEKLDYAWFLADAGKGTPGDRQHAIYAVSFKPTGDSFPMVWAPDSTVIPAEDVTERYINIYESITELRKQAGTHVPVKLRMYKGAASTSNSGDRVAANVDVFRGADQMGGGRTSGPFNDMNHVLTFDLEKNSTYTFKYENANGQMTEVTATIGDEPAEVIAFME